MLLRRIITHLQSQNWAAVGLDFVIVVVGVFIGLQAQAWKIERDERKLEVAYLQRVLSDIDLSIQSTEEVRQRLLGFSEDYQLVVRALTKCSLSLEERETFSDGMSHLGKVGPSVFVLSTMEEMLSAGKFSLIQNESIRTILNGLKRDSEYQAEIRLALYSYIEEMATFAGRQATLQYEVYPGPWDSVGWGAVQFDFPALCKNTEVQAAVSRVRYMTDNMVSLNDRALIKLGAAREALTAEMSVR